MSADKYPSIFSCQMEAIVYLYEQFEECNCQISLSAVNRLESTAKVGLARFARLFAGLARKAWLGTAWQALSRPGFCGSPGHKSLAFLARNKQCQGFLDFLAK